jgi:hypothetical protein
MVWFESPGCQLSPPPPPLPAVITAPRCPRSRRNPSLAHPQSRLSSVTIAPTSQENSPSRCSSRRAPERRRRTPAATIQARRVRWWLHRRENRARHALVGIWGPTGTEFEDIFCFLKRRGGRCEWRSIGPCRCDIAATAYCSAIDFWRFYTPANAGCQSHSYFEQLWQTLDFCLNWICEKTNFSLRRSPFWPSPARVPVEVAEVFWKAFIHLLINVSFVVL